MSRKRRTIPAVPEVRGSLASDLRALFAPLAPASGDQSVLTSRHQAELIHTLFRKTSPVMLSKAPTGRTKETIQFLIDSGLAQLEKETIRPLFQLQTCQGLLFLADLPENSRLPGYVLPIGAAGRFMARLTIRMTVDTALDMGCGTGVQALLLSQHTRQVVATDINPRALALTRLNASLNGIGKVTTLPGSYFEPVADRRFDLVVFNAPYILAPLKDRPDSYTGDRRDAYLHEFLRALPHHLNDGGFAQVLTNWILRKNESWWMHLQETLTGLGMDTLAFCRAVLHADRYADYWLQFEIDRRNRPAQYALNAIEWRRWYRRHRIDRIGFGSITLRRRRPDTHPNWMRFENAGESFGNSLSDQLLAIFQNQDLLAQNPELEWLMTCRPAPVNISVRPGNHPPGAGLQITAGQVIPLKIRRITIQALGMLDGKTSLAKTITTIARQEGLKEEDVRPILAEDMSSLAHCGWVTLQPPPV